MIGGYLTPPALSTGEDHPWILFGYVFLLNAGGPAAGAKAAMEGARADRRRRDRFSSTQPGSADGSATRIVRWPRCLRSPFTRNSASPRCPSCGPYFNSAASIALALIWRDQATFVWWNLAMVAAGLATAYRRSLGRGAALDAGMFLAPVLALVQSRCFVRGDLRGVPDLLCLGLLARRRTVLAGLGLIAANAAIYYAASYTLLNPAHHQYMGLLAAAVGGIHLLLARHFEARSEATDADPRRCACVRHAGGSHPVRRIPHHHRLGARRSRPGVALRPIPEPLAAGRSAGAC